MQNTIELLPKGIRYLENEPMSRHTSFRIGGPAELMLLPSSADELKAALAALYSHGIQPVVVGNGSNLLVSDRGISGVVIKLADNFSSVSVSGDRISCDAGAPLLRICTAALDSSLSGAEGLYGIPGTAGGAAFMNAGAFGYETKDIIEKVCFTDFAGKTYESTDAAGYGYRHSPFSDGGFVITGAVFRFTPADRGAISEKMSDVKRRREEKQPLNYPSAGSVFKRPENNYAAALIEQAGMKGFSSGGAEVSVKHSGFIVNKGGATCEDVRRVIDAVRDAVFGMFGITLETEIRMLGE